MTMAQFAEDLSAMATGYLKEPVVDATGVTGAFDFRLELLGDRCPQRRPRRRRRRRRRASAPTGALSLPDAIRNNSA